MHPMLFRMPGSGHPVSTYTVVLWLGLILGMALATRAAQRSGLGWRHGLRAMLYGLPAVYVGGRLNLVLFEWRTYFIEQPWTAVRGLSFRIPSALAFWEGGRLLWGGLLFMGVAFFFYCRHHDISLAQLMDAVCMAFPVGLFFLRIGCFSSGCCFGKPAYRLGPHLSAIPETALHVEFPVGSIAFKSWVTGADETTMRLLTRLATTPPLYPVQLYEAGAALLILLAMVLARPYQRAHGQMAWLCLVTYALSRFFLEFLRGDNNRGMLAGWPLSYPQVGSLIVLGLALAYIPFARYLLARRRPG